VSEREIKAFSEFGVKVQEVYPHFKGPISPEESISMMLKVIEKASVAGGDGGSFVSHYGTKQWV
jgi:hypothetical protein